jgi:hypothetical protein
MDPYGFQHYAAMLYAPGHQSLITFRRWMPHSDFRLQKALSPDFALCCSLFLSSIFSISISCFKFRMK